jgi:GAF domain-containing protein
MTSEHPALDEGPLGVIAMAALARALDRPRPLFRLVELASEHACDVLQAASLSISEVEVETGTSRTIINVGILGPGEARWPDQEAYSIDEASRLSKLVLDLVPWTADIEDPCCDPFEAELLRRLHKGSAMAAPILVDGRIWGEIYATRLRGRRPFGTEDMAYAVVLAAVLGGAISRAVRDEVAGTGQAAPT